VLPESAPSMVALFAQLVRNPAFSDSALERLKENAIRRLNTQSSQAALLASARANAILFPGNPADRRPTEAGIRQLTRNEIVAFHSKYYVPQRAQLYVAGTFDGKSVERAARSAFETWARGVGQSFVLPAGFSATGQEREGRPLIHLIDRPGSTQARVQISFPVVDQPHADLSVLNEINMVMGSTQTARIIANVRERHGYSYNVSSRLARRPGSTQWVVSGDMTNSVVGASIREILSEISRLPAEPPDSVELGGFQSFMAGILISENSTAQGIIDMLRLLDLYGMNRSYLQTFVGSVYDVSGKDIQRVARKYLQPASAVIVVVGDRNAILSQLAEIGEVVD
ncbi:MAG TPA: pitrilysin family protein, partial [Gemmatimonadaceae bacterium]|nr:pitrilysin family protein [Gemmatimonadaceae bacterium]